MQSVQWAYRGYFILTPTLEVRYEGWKLSVIDKEVNICACTLHTGNHVFEERQECRILQNGWVGKDSAHKSKNMRKRLLSSSCFMRSLCPSGSHSNNVVTNILLPHQPCIHFLRHGKYSNKELCEMTESIINYAMYK